MHAHCETAQTRGNVATMRPAVMRPIRFEDTKPSSRVEGQVAKTVPSNSTLERRLASGARIEESTDARQHFAPQQMEEPHGRGVLGVQRLDLRDQVVEAQRLVTPKLRHDLVRVADEGEARRGAHAAPTRRRAPADAPRRPAATRSVRLWHKQVRACRTMHDERDMNAFAQCRGTSK